MRQLLIGIDSGTQSTKALVVDASKGKVLGAAASAYDLISNLPAGAKEQHPHTWRDATASAIRRALLGAFSQTDMMTAVAGAVPWVLVSMLAAPPVSNPLSFRSTHTPSGRQTTPGASSSHRRTATCAVPAALNNRT